MCLSVSERSSAMSLSVSERSASMRSFTLWMSALVARFELSRATRSFARTSACFSVNPFAWSCPVFVDT